METKEYLAAHDRGLITLAHELHVVQDRLAAVEIMTDTLHDMYPPIEEDKPGGQMTDAEVVEYYDARIDELEDRIENDKQKVSMLVERRLVLSPNR